MEDKVKETAHIETRRRRVLRALYARYEQAMAWASRHEKVVLVSVFLLALALRVLYMALFVGLDSPPMYDGIGYHRWALEALESQTYTLAGEPTAVRPPGYHLALAATYLVFGYD